MLAEKGVLLERLSQVSVPINSALLLADKLLPLESLSVFDNIANWLGYSAQ